MAFYGTNEAYYESWQVPLQFKSVLKSLMTYERMIRDRERLSKFVFSGAFPGIDRRLRSSLEEP